MVPINRHCMAFSPFFYQTNDADNVQVILKNNSDLSLDIPYTATTSSYSAMPLHEVVAVEDFIDVANVLGNFLVALYLLLLL